MRFFLGVNVNKVQTEVEMKTIIIRFLRGISSSMIYE